MKAMFTLTVFKILLLEARLVLAPVLQGTGNEKVNRLMSYTSRFFVT